MIPTYMISFHLQQEASGINWTRSTTSGEIPECQYMTLQLGFHRH